MTNADVIKDLLNPRDDQIKTYSDWVEIEIQRQGINFSCTLEWWNAPYQPKRGYKDGKSDVLDEVRTEIEQIAYPSTTIYRILEIIDKHKAESKEPATVAKFHDFYPEDPATYPPADKELLVKNHVGDNFIAYLGYDDGEDGGWGFYNEGGDFIADVTEIDAWMPIPQHERDKNYIPVQEREKKTIFAETYEDTEEEKDR